MSDLPEMDIEELDESEDVNNDRELEISDPNLPVFETDRPLQRMDTPDGSALGVDYPGDDSSLITPAERVAYVRAAMARDN